VLLTVVSSGCTQWYYDIGRSINETVVTEATEDISLGQALELLGPPQRVSSTSNGYALAWEHWRVRENSLGISLGALGVELMSIDWGNARAKGEFLLLTFDNEHQLSGRAHGRWPWTPGSAPGPRPAGPRPCCSDSLKRSMPLTAPIQAALASSSGARLQG
jgi:hypothetical protein